MILLLMITSIMMGDDDDRFGGQVASIQFNLIMIMMANRMRIIIDHVDRNYISMMIFNSGTDKEDCSSLR